MTVLSKFENYKMPCTRDSIKLVAGKSCLRYCRVGQLLKGADLRDSPLRREASPYLLEVFIKEIEIVLIEHNYRRKVYSYSGALRIATILIS